MAVPLHSTHQFYNRGGVRDTLPGFVGPLAIQASVALWLAASVVALVDSQNSEETCSNRPFLLLPLVFFLHSLQ